MGTVAGFIILAATAIAVLLIVLMVKSLFRGDGLTAEKRRNKQTAAHQAKYLGSSLAESAESEDVDGMNEGDYHNGPGGYTTGAYETSFYGTIYDRELDHDEGDEHH